jgi:hypothetical protein
VFETEDKEINWAPKNISDGVYFMTILYVDCKNEEKKIGHSVTVISSNKSKITYNKKGFQFESLFCYINQTTIGIKNHGYICALLNYGVCFSDLPELEWPLNCSVQYDNTIQLFYLLHF